ncbi:MAG: hypothetical protein WD623_10415 [Marinobacter sp.]|uniref:hypothetical protein n=1 Tax=Marinobacter sp. TaxID=50741 RepID=UPI0034A08771
MNLNDPRTPEDEETWSARGPKIVRRPGEVRALIWRMLPWYVAAFFAAIAVGAVLNSFWFSAMLAALLTAFSPSPVRRRLHVKTRVPLYDHHLMVGVIIAALVAIGLVCEWELQNRINEFENQRPNIIAQAEKALNFGEYSKIDTLADRYRIIPGRPFKPFVAKSQKLKEEAYLKTPEGKAEKALELYRLKIESKNLEGEQ